LSAITDRSEPGTGHVLDQDRGRARNEPPEVALHQPRIGVGAATRRQADDELDGLAGVEALRGRCVLGDRSPRREAESQQRNGGSCR
jgi:hypothetical protein